MNPKRSGEIRLHTDQDGHVWLQAIGGEPVDCGPDTDGLVSQSEILEAEKICLLAGRYNATIITSLHSVRCQTGRPRTILLGNPWLLPGGDERLETIFGRMDSLELAPSLGGWRELTERDYVTYALAGVLQQSGGKLNNLAERLLRAHPVWPAVSFLGDANLEAACHLVCAVLDPRWHVDSTKPDARKRLLSRFGLGQGGPRNVGYLMGFEQQAAKHSDTAKLVLDTWTGGDYVPPRPDAIDARGFLWRLAAKDSGGVKGMLRSCQVFLAFLHEVWLDNLTPLRRYEPVVKKLGRKQPSMVSYMRMVRAKSYSPQLFVPEHFFELSTEVKAWQQHTDRLRQRA